MLWVDSEDYDLSLPNSRGSFIPLSGPNNLPRVSFALCTPSRRTLSTPLFVMIADEQSLPIPEKTC